MIDVLAAEWYKLRTVRSTAAVLAAVAAVLVAYVVVALGAGAYAFTRRDA